MERPPEHSPPGQATWCRSHERPYPTSDVMRRPRPGRVSLRRGALEGTALLEIDDDGVGLDPEAPGAGMGLEIGATHTALGGKPPISR